MKNLKKLIGFMIVFMVVMGAFCSTSFAATAGQLLPSPESGWQRYDDTDSNIIYSGSVEKNLKYNSIEGFTRYKGTASFKFYGTKLRIISYLCQEPSGYYSSNVQVKIDGIEAGTFSNSSTSQTYRILLFEKTNLSIGVHTVEITPLDVTPWGTVLDAIDIDDTGYLVDVNLPSAPTNLTSKTESGQVNLKWDAVEGATSYNIKRATTQGGSYTTIGTSTTNTYSDTTVTNGKTYYYVISAIVNGTESENSNEASATPTAPIVIGNSGILEITMTNGQIKEYDLTATELDAFLTWYDNRSNGTAKAYYVFNKKSNIKPFLSRKEYISFDKISSFEVKEYAE